MIELWWIGGIAILSTFLWTIFIGDYHSYKLLKKIPGPGRLELLIEIIKKPPIGPAGTELCHKLRSKYGTVFCACLGKKPFIFLSDPKDLEVILGSREHIEKAEIYTFLKPWLGNGSLICPGEVWMKKRKVTKPTMQSANFEIFTEIFNRNTDVLIDVLKDKVNGPVFDVQPILSSFTLDIICESTTGIYVNTQRRNNVGFSEGISEICSLIHTRMASPWLKSDVMWRIFGYLKQQNQALKNVHSFTDQVINDKVKLMKINCNGVNETTEIDPGTSGLLLDSLVEKTFSGTSEVFTNLSDIRDEVNTMFFAGHDTSGYTLSFVLTQLAKYPHIQDKVYSEICGVLSKPEEYVSLQDCSSLEYTEQVIKETLRLYPVVPVVARILTKDTLLPSGYMLPNGATVLILMRFIHKNKDYYEHPEDFNPDNFAPNVKRHPYSYIPFSGGLRNCIGQRYAMAEMKIAIAKVLMKYRIVYAGPEYDYRLSPTLIMHSDNGFHIKIEPREKKIG